MVVSNCIQIMYAIGLFGLENGGVLVLQEHPFCLI